MSVCKHFVVFIAVGFTTLCCVLMGSWCLKQFDSSSPGADSNPKSEDKKFRATNFFRLYNEIDKHELTPNQVYAHLQEGYEYFSSSNSSLAFSFQVAAGYFKSVTTRDGMAKAAVALWSAHEPAYAYQHLQFALINDDRDKLQYWIWVIRALNIYLVEHPPKHGMVTYRGSKLCDKAVDELSEGVVYRGPLYLASSEDLSQAENFRECANYIAVFNVPAFSNNACPIAEHSHYSFEVEVLIPPYTRLRLKKKDVQNKRLEYDVLENLVGDELEPTNIPALLLFA